MIIVGAGMSGLLAANMLRRFKPVIVERQSKLPNNHAALLRFRSDAVQNATGIPFKEVLVHKAIYHQGQIFTTPNLYLSNLYSQKVTGRVMNRSILNLEPVKRYIAPPDFIEQMSAGLDIIYDASFNPSDEIELDGPVISTIPLPYLADMAGIPEVKKMIFEFREITSHQFILPNWVDVYQTIYIVDEHIPIYRASITGNILIAESVGSGEYVTGQASYLLENRFGIKAEPEYHSSKTQKYGKLLPINEKLRQQLIYEITSKLGIYSLGRFATWRQLLMDDVVEDIRKIEGMLGNDYARRMHYES